MKHTLIGGLVGGIIVFVWSFLAWVILPLHEPHMKGVANEEALVSAFQSSLKEKAVYVVPKNPGMQADQVSMDAFAAKMKRGPTAMIIYDPAGSDLMMPRQMVVGVILDIIAACIVAWFLARSTAMSAAYIARVAYCGMFGIFVAFFTHLSYWNWMGYPGDFTSGLIVDGILSWLLAGLGIAAVVKAPKQATA
jgi:hypothetical protein